MKKTILEYTVQSYYGAWEDVHTATTKEEARQMREDYDDNEAGILHRVIVRRVTV